MQSHCAATTCHCLICLFVWVPAGARVFFHKVPMPSQQGYDNFPIGTGAHYVDYTLSSQLNLVTIPPTRHHSSDDSDPGSPPTRQGGSRPHAHQAQAQVDPVLLGQSGASRTYSSRMGMSTSSGGPYGHNLTINSALRSTTTPYYDRHTRTPDSPDLTRSVGHMILISGYLTGN